MNRYPVLMGISTLARILGWIGMVLAVLLGLWGVLDLLLASGAGAQTASAIVRIGVAIGILLGSIIILLIAEAARVLPDIEANTARTAERLANSGEGKPVGAVALTITGLD